MNRSKKSEDRFFKKFALRKVIGKHSLLLILVILYSGSNSIQAQGDNLLLWYSKPASTWNEALPIGNGRLGAMFFGGVYGERIQLNEESVWTGNGRLVIFMEFVREEDLLLI